MSSTVTHHRGGGGGNMKSICVIHTYINTHASTCTHTHALTTTHTHTLSLSYPHTRFYTCMHACTRTYTHTLLTHFILVTCTCWFQILHMKSERSSRLSIKAHTDEHKREITFQRINTELHGNAACRWSSYSSWTLIYTITLYVIIISTPPAIYSRH